MKRRPLSEAPAAVKELVAQMEKEGDCLVFENEHQKPVVSIVSEKARRQEGARRLNAFLDSLPPSPYSEEEVNADIEEAIRATKGQPLPGDARTKATV